MHLFIIKIIMFVFVYNSFIFFFVECLPGKVKVNPVGKTSDPICNSPCPNISPYSPHELLEQQLQENASYKPSSNCILLFKIPLS